MIVAAVGFLSA